MPHGFGLGLDHGVADLLYVGMWIAFFISLWRPHWGLYYIVPILPWQTLRFRLHTFFLGKSLVDIVLLGVFLGLCLQRQGRIIPWTSLNRVLIAMVVFYYISLWQGAFYLGGTAFPTSIDDPRFSEWKNFAEMPVIFFLTLAAIKNKRQMKLLIGLMCVAVLLVNQSFYNMMSGRDFSHFNYDLRDAGVLGYAGENGMAAFQGEFMLFILGLYLWEKRVYLKLSMLALMATNMYCLLYCLSRGGYLAVLAGLIFLGFAKNRVLLIAVALFLVSWQTIVPNAVRERVMMTYSEGELDPSAETRVDLWEDAMNIIKTNPVTGTGYNTYSYMHRLGYGDTHNLYVKVALETGIVGLAFMVWMLVRFLAQGYSLAVYPGDPFLASLGLGFSALMVCAIVVNLFGDRWNYIQINGYLWALLGCVMRGQLIRTEENHALDSAEGNISAETGILDPALMSA
jgi:putative inorganic carbon (HCO3(-)) transporter